MPVPPPNLAKANDHPDLIVRGKRVITPEGQRAASIHIRAGVITAISSYEDIPAGCAIHEAGDLVVMPGLVDTHVHINEPGRTEWEGFTTATAAAAAGGITTLIEMPLNSVPATTSTAAFREKLGATTNKLSVDTGFWGGLVPGNANQLRALWEAGCFGFKCFLVDSGVQEFAAVRESDLRHGLAEIAKLDAPLLAHAELPGPIEDATEHRPPELSPRAYKTWLESRPRVAEDQAIALLLRLAAEYDARIHIVHLSSSDSLVQIRRAKETGAPVNVETCPHYLTFASEEIPDSATHFKCAPPIRERENRDELWAALADGTIDMIATDHSPCPPQMKNQQTGDFLTAWGGISSLQLSLPAVWTQARARGYSLTHIAQWMCAAPARLAGLENKKGSIAMGRDADLVIWNPDATFRVDPAQLHHRHKLTPYAGHQLMGTIKTTFLRGKKIFESGRFCSAPLGEVLLRHKL
jgi:allantoinase